MSQIWQLDDSNMSSTLRCVFSNDVLVHGVQLKICTILCFRQKFYQTNEITFLLVLIKRSKYGADIKQFFWKLCRTLRLAHTSIFLINCRKLYTYLLFRHGVWDISYKNQDAMILAIINVFSSIENSEYIIKTTNFVIMFQIKTIFWKSTANFTIY